MHSKLKLTTFLRVSLFVAIAGWFALAPTGAAAQSDAPAR